MKITSFEACRIYFRNNYTIGALRFLLFKKIKVILNIYFCKNKISLYYINN